MRQEAAALLGDVCRVPGTKPEFRNATTQVRAALKRKAHLVKITSSTSPRQMLHLTPLNTMFHPDKCPIITVNL